MIKIILKVNDVFKESDIDLYTPSSSCSDINECSIAPCQNAGTCVDGVNEYTCACADGYTGLQCETGRCIEWTLRSG